MPETDAVELDLYDLDLTTKLGTLPAVDVGLYFELNQTGSGNCKVHTLRSLASGLVQQGQFIRVNYRGAVQGGFFVEDIGKNEASQGESADLWTPIQGRGPMKMLESAMVWSDGTDASTRDFAEQPKAAMLIALIDEAKARGGLAVVDYDFTASVDSNGDAWTDAEAMQFSVGKTLLDVCREISDFGIDTNMTVNEDGTFTLQAFANGKGSDKSTTIYFRRGVNCTEITVDGRGMDFANALLLKHENGYVAVSDNDSIATHGRVEKMIDAHDAGNSDNALRYGQALLALKKDPKKEVSMQMYDGVSPYVFTDYDTGDWVTKDISGVEEVLRVRSITLSWTDAEKADVTVGLNSLVIENEIKQQNDIRKLFEMIRRQNDGKEVTLPFWAAIGKLPGEATTGTVIRAVAISDAGYLYAGGTITKIGNVTVNNVARYNIANGQWSQMGSGVDNDIYAITCSGAKVFIARDAGASEEGVIYWDEDTETYESIGVGLSPAVHGRALCVDGDNLYIGGLFSGAGGITSENIILYDIATNTFTAMDGLDPDIWATHIRAIAVIGNKVFCGGEYHETSGDALFVWEWGGVEAWTAIGGWTSAVSSGIVEALTAYNGKLIIGGVFEDVQGEPSTSGVAVYDPDTGVVSSLGGGMYEEPVPWPSGGGTTTGRTQALLVVGSDLYIAGYYHYIGESQMDTNSIIKWNGANFENLTTGINNNGYCLAAYNGNIVVGGAFDSAGGKAIKYIAAYITNLEEILSYLEGNGEQTASSYTHPNHSGDVVSVGDGAQTIQSNVVDNTKLADMAEGTVKARVTAGSGDPEDVPFVDLLAAMGVPGAQTAKRVIISDASGAITTSDYVAYDDTTKILSLGEAISGFVQSVLWNLSSSISRVLNMITWGAGSSSRFKGTFARGTIEIPTEAQDGDTLSRFSGAGYDGATAIQNAATSGEMRVEASENFDSTHHGTNLGFWITLPGTTTMVRVGTFTENGLNLESGYEFLINGVAVGGGGGDAIYGDGSDGAVVLDGTNTFDWASLSGSGYTLLRDIYVSDMTVNSGIILRCAGYRVFGTGTLDNSGTIHNNGFDAVGSTAGAGGSGGYLPSGVNGGAGVASGAAAAAGSAPSFTNNGTLIGSFGGRGGSSWLSAITNMGAGAIQDFTTDPYLGVGSGGQRMMHNLFSIMQKYLYSTTQYIPSIGGGGGGKSAVGTTCNSGGGGGGGGAMLLACKTIINQASAVISCDGGDGGNASGTGANAGGGGGGAGGIVWLAYNTLTNDGTITANGGVGGSSVGGGTTPLKATFKSIPISFSSISSGVYRFKAAFSKNTLYFLPLHVQGVLTPTSVVGGGLTWTLINSVDFNTTASPTRRLLLYAAYGTPVNNEDTYKVIITFASAPTAVSAQLIEVQNATGTIVQSAVNSVNSATTLTVTLPGAFGSANAAAFGVFARSGGTAGVAGAGFVRLTETASPIQMVELGYNDTTVDASHTTAAAIGAIACEIQAVSAAESGANGQDGYVVHIQN